MKVKFITVQTGPATWAVAQSIYQAELGAFIVFANKIPTYGIAQAIRRYFTEGGNINDLPESWVKFKVSWN